MSVASLVRESTHEDTIAVGRLALVAGDPSGAAILALDLGQKTGWAVRNADGAIASGTVEFKPSRWEGGGMVYLRFRAWLQEVDETAGGIGAVYFEEVRFHSGVTAAHAFGGYLAHLTAWAEMNKVPYRGVPVGTIKRHVTGKGNADKAAVIAAVRALGFAPADASTPRRSHHARSPTSRGLPAMQSDTSAVPRHRMDAGRRRSVSVAESTDHDPGKEDRP